MNILVTGGLGHIGSKLIDDFSNSIKIKKIIVIDNLSTNRYSSLFNLNKKKFQFIFEDIKKLNLKEIIQNHDIDIIIHLAAITDAASSFKIKSKLFHNNFGITKKVIDSIKYLNTKIIFISSTSVYGENSSLVNEKSKLNPQSPYAECKIKEESYLKKQLNKTDQYIIFRFGTIAGTSKGMRFHTAVNKFCFQANFNLPIEIWRTALRQYRPYLSLTDAIRAINFVISKNLFDNNSYNLLTANLRPIDLIDFIKKKKKNIKINFINNKIMNLLSYKVSNKKFEKKGFAVRGNIERDIKNTMDILNKERIKF